MAQGRGGQNYRTGSGWVWSSWWCQRFNQERGKTRLGLQESAAGECWLSSQLVGGVGVDKGLTKKGARQGRIQERIKSNGGDEVECAQEAGSVQSWAGKQNQERNRNCQAGLGRMGGQEWSRGSHSVRRGGP